MENENHCDFVKLREMLIRVKVGNKLVRARQYPWGVVQVENENHCDFVKLREMLIRVNMEDLREQTHSRHYELYRRCKLEEMGFQDSSVARLAQAGETGLLREQAVT